LRRDVTTERIDDNDEHPEKQFLPSDVTDSGIVIDDNESIHKNNNC
jgi:hypothetical protein